MIDDIFRIQLVFNNPSLRPLIFSQITDQLVIGQNVFIKEATFCAVIHTRTTTNWPGLDNILHNSAGTKELPLSEQSESETGRSSAVGNTYLCTCPVHGFVLDKWVEVNYDTKFQFVPRGIVDWSDAALIFVEFC